MNTILTEDKRERQVKTHKPNITKTVAITTFKSPVQKKSEHVKTDEQIQSKWSGSSEVMMKDRTQARHMRVVQKQILTDICKGMKKKD